MKTISTLVFFLAFFSANLVASDSISIDDSWVRAAPPTSSNTAAYMKISNHTDKAITLKSANTDAAKMTQLHLSSMVDGLMTMEEQKQGIEIPANSTFELKPASYHIMIMGLKQPLPQEGTLTFELKFSNGHTTTLNAPIKAATSPAHEHDMKEKMPMEMNKKQ